MNDLAQDVSLILSHQFKVSPFFGEPYAASLVVPELSNLGEFECAVLFDSDSSIPVCFSPAQRVRLLDHVVKDIHDHVSAVEFILLQFHSVDFGIQLTSDMLADDVLIVADPVPTGAWMLQSTSRRNIVTIEQSLRTDAVERGNNELKVQLLRPTSGVDAALRERVPHWLRY